MLFIGGNPRAVDSTLEYDDEHPYITVAVKERWDITKVVLCAVFLYAITSLFTVILYYPISLISLIFPTVVLVYTKIALKGDQRRNLWFCIFAGFAGFALKISAIIVFVIMFPIGKEEPSRFRGSSSLRKLISVTDLATADSKTLFFGVVCLADLCIALISCCMQWHLIAFNGCDTPPKSQRMRRVENPL